MKHDVLKISDFLPLNATKQNPIAFSSLTPAEIKQYTESANKFVDEFNAAHPEGLKVRLQIVRLNMVPNSNGRVTVVVAPNDNYNTQAITYPVPVANSIANSLGVPSFASLASIIASTAHAPSFVEATIKLVKQGEEYLRSDGTMAKYKCPGVAVIGREEIKLSEAAVKRIGNLTMEVDKAEFLEFRKSISQQSAPTPAGSGAEHGDEDLLGG